MTDAGNSVKIKQFERVMAGPSTTLLRISGKISRRRPATAPRPILVADDGHAVHRFAALPSPPEARGVLRFAYSVPASLITIDTVFSLELGDGGVVALPAPTAGAARFTATEPEPAPPPAIVDGGTTPPDDDDGTTPAVDGDGDRRSDLLHKLTELSARLAEAERAGAEHDAARAAAEAETAGARQAAQVAHEQAHALQQRVAELEADAQTDANRVTELNDALRERHEQMGSLERELAGALERATEAEAANATSAAALEELETWRGELERRLTSTTNELAATETRLHDSELELERTTAELASPRAAPPEAAAGVDADAWVRIRRLEAEREELARGAEELVLMLARAERVAELGRDLSLAREHAESLQAAAANDGAVEPVAADDSAEATLELPGLSPHAEAEAELAALSRPAEAEAELAALSERAEAEAASLAARELAEAVGEARSPHRDN